MEKHRIGEILRLIQTGLGLALIALAVIFLWRGISATGSVVIDFPFFSSHINTTSAGLALLIVGTILLVLSRDASIDSQQQGDKSIPVIIIGAIFYLIIGLLPVIAYIIFMWYIHSYHPDKVKEVAGIGVFIIFLEIPLILWVVSEVKKLIGGGPKE